MVATGSLQEGHHRPVSLPRSCRSCERPNENWLCSFTTSSHKAVVQVDFAFRINFSITSCMRYCFSAAPDTINAPRPEKMGGSARSATSDLLGPRGSCTRFGTQAPASHSSPLACVDVLHCLLAASSRTDAIFAYLLAVRSLSQLSTYKPPHMWRRPICLPQGGLLPASAQYRHGRGRQPVLQQMQKKESSPLRGGRDRSISKTVSSDAVSKTTQSSTR